MRATALVGAGLALLLAGADAHATTIVVPNANEDTLGAFGNGIPFNFTTMRFQQVYAASELGGTAGTITQLAFRPGSNSLSPASDSFTAEVHLSHTSADPTALSLTFADNVGADDVVVLSGTVTFTTAGLENVFDIILDVDDVFEYDGTSNLLLDIRVSGANFSTQIDGVSSSGVMGRAARYSSTTDPTASFADGFGLVTQFTIEPASVPEPSSSLLLVTGLVGLAAFGRPRRAERGRRAGAGQPAGRSTIAS